MGNYSEGDSGYDPGTSYTDISGDVFTADANGVLYLSMTNRDPQNNWDNLLTVPNNNGQGRGPGDTAGSSTFDLGSITNGLGTAIRNIGAAIPDTVNTIRQAKTAVTAINTPTATQQWLQTPLQSQIFIGLAVFAVVFLVLRKGHLG
jgi:hypothetical protein